MTRRVDFTEEMAKLAACLFNGSGRHRETMLDCMIAATALTPHSSVATSNRKDFEAFQRFDLRLATTATLRPVVQLFHRRDLKIATAHAERQQGASRHVDRRVGANDHANDQRDRERVNHLAAKEE